MNITATKKEYPTRIFVQLTDGCQVFGQRQFKAPKRAVKYIKQLEDMGHRCAPTSTETINELLGAID